jgi:hypothetical protein
MPLRAAAGRITRALFLAVAAALAVAVPGRAQDWWTEVGIPVDVSAENAVAARQKGIEAGQREGLRRLLERLAPAEERARLPSVQGLPIARYVRSYEIAEEKVAPTRWLATLNVTFDPDAVSGLLTGRGLSVLEPTGAPVLLVVPAEERQGELVLWAREEPWWQAWERVASAERALRLVLPLGDLADLAALTPQRVEAGDRSTLDRLAERYGAADAVLVVAGPRPGPAAAGLGVRFLAGAGVLRGDPEPLAVVAAGGADPLEAGARQAAARLVETWRKAGLVRSDRPAELALAVPLADLAGWVQIRRELETLPEIREVRITSIARHRAELVLRYLGDLGRLREGLARRGLELAQESGGWQLRAAGGQPATSPR